MQTVIIPGSSSLWTCNINGKSYSYQGGTTQTVPDEVAALIAGISNFPPEAPEVDPPFEAEAPSGSGLPDPSSYSDGTVLIKVGDEWKAQSGYGYEGEPAFEPIEWDGDTEGRESVEDTYYRVADAISVDDLVGSIFTYTEGDISPQYVVSQSDISELEGIPNVFAISIFDSAIDFLVITEDTMGVHSGVYFEKIGTFTYYSLTAPSSVTTIDQKFIHSVIPAAPTEDGEYVLSCTISSGEATYSWESATAE